MTARDRMNRGFTLIEVMGVILVTAMVIGFATDYYIDLSRATARASENTRAIRHATALLDRVGRDFESAVLVTKPPEVDPLAHPWLFVAESQISASGSDHIKFVTRNFQPRRSAEHESDLTVVAYSVRSSEDGDHLELYRWTATQLPESLDRSFPSEEDEASVLLAEGLLEFSVKFYSDEAGESDNWDSTTMLQSGMLPTSVEITAAIASPDADDPDEVPRYRKTVLLPMRPLDMAAMLAPEIAGVNDGELDDEDDAEGEGKNAEEPTMADCFNFNAIDPESAKAYSAFSEFADGNMGQPWSQARGMIPSELLKYVYAEPECQ
jgi:prepilin-type N-terminal cleavage/methylation domain-containing protein